MWPCVAECFGTPTSRVIVGNDLAAKNSWVFWNVWCGIWYSHRSETIRRPDLKAFTLSANGVSVTWVRWLWPLLRIHNGSMFTHTACIHTYLHTYVCRTSSAFARGSLIECSRNDRLSIQHEGRTSWKLFQIPCVSFLKGWVGALNVAVAK